ASLKADKVQVTGVTHLGPGQRVLDAGSGTGEDAQDMARQVGSSGGVVGIDNSQAMVAVAQQRAAGLGLPVEFRVADMLNLPFSPESFDGCRADRSLMHVPDPRKALLEMMRVTRPGGNIVVFEVDFEMVVIDADDRVLARKVVNSWCDGFRNGWLGRHIPALLAGLGLKDLKVAGHTLTLTPELAALMVGPATVAKTVEAGRLTPAEGRKWLDHLGELERSGRFFSTLTGYIVAGHK